MAEWAEPYPVDLDQDVLPVINPLSNAEICLDELPRSILREGDVLTLRMALLKNGELVMTERKVIYTESSDVPKNGDKNDWSNYRYINAESKEEYDQWLKDGLVHNREYLVGIERKRSAIPHVYRDPQKEEGRTQFGPYPTDS